MKNGESSERSRISRLASACLRVNSSLDLNTVLHEIVESACDLTGARYGLITTHDETGVLDELVTTGISNEGLKEVLQWSDAYYLFEHLRDISGPLRVPGMRSYVEKLGLSADVLPRGPFLGTPMFRGDVHVGNFNLAGKKNREQFTEEDEEILLLFASQAATAMANARAYRDEQSARADLEALIETTPVGVVVFEARTGNPVSINREGKRIVESVAPGMSADELLQQMKCRLGDGSEILVDKESLVEHLTRAETVRAEELVVWGPGGKSATLLINVTPIRTKPEEVGSVIVTMQDLAPLQEIERMRTEFVGMVSHELRTPLTSIKGSTAALLDSSTSLDRAEMREYFRIIDQQANLMRSLISDLLDVGRIETGSLAVTPVPEDLYKAVEQARSTFNNGENTQTLLVDLPANLPRIHAELRRLEQVLNNLLSNAARHSPASSTIRIKAEPVGAHVAISVVNEGQGLEPEQLRRVFQKYSSIGPDENERYGLGLAICKGIVEAHGGRIWAESAGVGHGATFTFTMPAATEEGERAAMGFSPKTGRDADEEAAAPVILVVDDDPRALGFIRDTLNSSGYKPVVTGEYQDLSELIETHAPQLVLLDLVLPGIDGIELMTRMPELAELPVIFISAYGRDETVAKALESGAADYIVKPFSPTELTARIRVALRKHREPVTLTIGDLTINYDQRLVTLGGENLTLTATEFELLRLLSINAGRVLPYDMLLKQVWGTRNNNDRRRLRTFVKKLRNKLEKENSRGKLIENLRGFGYRMLPP